MPLPAGMLAIGATYTINIEQAGSGILNPTVYNEIGVATTAGNIHAPGQTVTLKNIVGVGDASPKFLAELQDVTEVVKEDGVMLQWEANTNQYEIDFITLDGGTF